jgi:predicted DNA-binding transcriptional regulator YafY
MSKKDSIQRYSLIITKLRKNPATFNEIADYLDRESELQDFDFNISKRTFKRDLEDISSIYNIEIQYDFSQKIYFIKYDNDEVMQNRIFEAFDTFNALSIHERISKYIDFENRKPQGTQYLNGLLHAIQNKHQLKFTYQKYWDEEISIRHVEPYALKEFKSRWYLMANDLKDNKIKSFALDRLSKLDVISRHFQSPVNFNVTEHFRHCFGIISPNADNPHEIVLSFDPFQGKYIKSLPLHESQEILKDNEEELLIRLKLYITYDFVMEVLSYGNYVKVIEPAELINQLKNAYRDALKQY